MAELIAAKANGASAPSHASGAAHISIASMPTAPPPTVSVAIAKPGCALGGAGAASSSPVRAPTTPPRGVLVPGGATHAGTESAVATTDFPYPAAQYKPHEFDVFLRALFRSAFGYDARTEGEREAAEKVGAALTFGEVLPSGVAKMLDDTHLNARNAKVLYDIGCGFGKLALQAFLAFENLDKVVGVELCVSRYRNGAAALRRLAEANPELFALSSTADTITFSVAKPPSVRSRTRSNKTKEATGVRTLELRNHNLFATPDVKDADVVICETAFPAEKKGDLVVLLSKLKPNARFLLYHSLASLPGVTVSSLAGSQRAQMRNPSEPGSCVLAEATAIAPGHTYPSSWSPEGALFDTWRRL